MVFFQMCVALLKLLNVAVDLDQGKCVLISSVNHTHAEFQPGNC